MATRESLIPRSPCTSTASSSAPGPEPVKISLDLMIKRNNHSAISSNSRYTAVPISRGQPLHSPVLRTAPRIAPWITSCPVDRTSGSPYQRHP